VFEEIAMKKEAIYINSLQNLRKIIAALLKKCTSQAKVIADLRHDNELLTDRFAVASAKLKLRNKNIQRLKTVVEDVQCEMRLMVAKNAKLAAELAEKDKVIERLNRNIELANQSCAANSADSGPWGSSLHERFIKSMNSQGGFVRQVQGGAAGTLN
jgi:predicted RNase H-like nuclease (RuvC/YqgF family)